VVVAGDGGAALSSFTAVASTAAAPLVSFASVKASEFPSTTELEHGDSSRLSALMLSRLSALMRVRWNDVLVWLLGCMLWCSLLTSAAYDAEARHATTAFAGKTFSKRPGTR
jgi:hypothetical protein